MLNKEQLLKNFSKDDKIFLSNIFDKIQKNINKNINILTSFLDMHEFEITIMLLNKCNVKYEIFDIQNMLERKVIILLNDYQENYIFDEIKCVKIIPKTKDRLKHKDYMRSFIQHTE